MAVEIERKFLVQGDAWRECIERQQTMRQGYLSDASRDETLASVRVRIAGEQARLTVKSAIAGAQRSEYEYAIPLNDAQQILNELCRTRVEKTRYWVRDAGRVWEVDVFEEANAGLVIAEVELERPDEYVELPLWVEREVTDQRRYYNAELARHPYRDW